MFKKNNTFTKRYNSCLKIITKYPDRIPIILEKKK